MAIRAPDGANKYTGDKYTGLRQTVLANSNNTTSLCLLASTGFETNAGLFFYWLFCLCLCHILVVIWTVLFVFSIIVVCRRGPASPTSPKTRRHRELILSPLAAYHSQMAGRPQGNYSFVKMDMNRDKLMWLSRNWSFPPVYHHQSQWVSQKVYFLWVHNNQKVWSS